MDQVLSQRVRSILHYLDDPFYSLVSTEDIVLRLSDNGFISNHPVINVQENLGRYVAVIQGELGGRYFGVYKYSGLFGLFEENNHQFCICGEHEREAGGEALAIDETGTLYTYNSDLKRFEPVASSVFVALEGWGVQNSLLDIAPQWYVFSTHELKVEEMPRLEENLIQLGLVRIIEASDMYLQWWSHPNLFVNNSIVLQDQYAEVVAYGRSIPDLEKLVDILKNVSPLVAALPFRLYPYQEWLEASSSE